MHCYSIIYSSVSPWGPSSQFSTLITAPRAVHPPTHPIPPHPNPHSFLFRRARLRQRPRGLLVQAVLVLCRPLPHRLCLHDGHDGQRQGCRHLWLCTVLTPPCAPISLTSYDTLAPCGGSACMPGTGTAIRCLCVRPRIRVLCSLGQPVSQVQLGNVSTPWPRTRC